MQLARGALDDAMRASMEHGGKMGRGWDFRGGLGRFVFLAPQVVDLKGVVFVNSPQS